MIIDGVKILEGSSLTNPVLPKGPTFPGAADHGELFVLTSGDAGLYAHNGVTWNKIMTAAEVQAVANTTPAIKLATPRTITLSGDVAGSAAFDGSANVSISATAADTGVGAGTYKSVTVDIKGRVTAGGNPTTLAGYGITDAIDISTKGVANGVATLDNTGVVPALQLPSYVDDVLEYANLATFPVTGVAGKIYVAIDTNKTYRWSGSVYVYITSGAVDSVAGKTGIVALTKSDVGLGVVDNTADSAKNVLSATKLTTARSIALSGGVTGSVTFDGTANVNISATIVDNSHSHTNYADKGTVNTFAGLQTFAAGIAQANNAITGIKTATFNSQPDIGVTSGAININWSAAQNQRQAAPTGAITYNFTAPPGVCHLQLEIVAAGAAQTITWPANVIWLGATWAAASSKWAMINFWWDGTYYWAMGANQV